MKKILSVMEWVLLCLILLLPVGKGICACVGYTFTLGYVTAFAVVTALWSVALVAVSFSCKNAPVGKARQIVSALLAPLSLLSAVFYLFERPQPLVAVSVLLTVVCCCGLAVKWGKPPALKITALVLSAVMLIPVLFFGIMLMTFGGLGQTTVVQTLPSPDGAYLAQVTDYNQGALGGDTFVEVQKSGGFDVLLFKITPQPQRIYTGEWGEGETMQIHWKNRRCLVINSMEYEIE